MLFLCLFLYPFVPTLGYLVNLWFMNTTASKHGDYNMKFARLEMFARVSHGITGCIEAPIQMVTTLYLMMKDVLPLPWDQGFHSSTITDSKGNTVNFQIPAASIFFTIIDIIKCAIMVNIFNVYIGQVDSMKTFKYYANLAAGHLPFFIHSICLRLLAYSYFSIYLNEIYCWVPVFLIWLSNLIIGYLTPKPPLQSTTKAALQRVESIERGKTSIPRFEKSDDAPIWLNSFLSVFIPSCPLDLIDPAMVNFYADKNVEVELKSGKKRTVPGKRIRDEMTKFNKGFQWKIIGRQVITSSIIMLATVATIWYKINYDEAWEYNNNILPNLHFNIFSAILAIMSISSFLFLKNLDIFELFDLNSESKKSSPVIKGFLLVAVTLLVLR